MKIDEHKRVLEALAEDISPGMLFQSWHACAADLKRNHADLFHAFGRKAIRLGQPIQAFNLICEGLVFWPDDFDLRYLGALALASAGSTNAALNKLIVLEKDISEAHPLFDKILNLKGRIEKEYYERLIHSPLRTHQGTLAIKHYTQSFERSGDMFPLINAATMCRLMDDKQQSMALATIAKEGSAKGDQNNYWVLATLGEACLLLGEFDEAIKYYQRAVSLVGSAIGDLATMRLQVNRLAQVMDIPSELHDVLMGGQIVIFVGHMIDAPDRAQARFPPWLESQVKREIEHHLEVDQAQFGYVSASNGADIIFAECMLARDGEVHITLPFRKEDFVQTSVIHGGAQWLDRFEAVLQHATSVTYTTKEEYLGHDALFQYTADYLCGAALLRGDRLGAPVKLLAVLDAGSAGSEGGTQMTLQSWGKNRRSSVIDLAKLRNDKTNTSPTTRTEVKILRQTNDRQVRTMLFADVKNFSKLSESQSPAFFSHVLSLIADTLANAKVKPVFSNTWGDGLFLVFENLNEAARQALVLRDAINNTDWGALGLPSDLTIRIGLHTGPVFLFRDPIIEKINFFGDHVNQAARIEPVTAPGQVYASEAVAALIRLDEVREFSCDYMGRIALAKGYDVLALYRLRRKGETE